MLGFLLAPYLVEKNLVETMQRDFGAGLRIENVEINPFVLSLRINGLELDSPDGKPSVRLDEFFVNFQLSSIFRLALTFDEVRFTSPELFVERDQSGNLDIAYLLDPGGATGTVEATVVETENAGLLQALVFRFTVENFIVHWSDRYSPDPVDTRLGPISIDVSELNTLPDRAGQQAVVIVTENTGTLSWNGDLQLNPLGSSGRASLADSHFPLASAYLRHQAGLEVTEGTANVEFDYRLVTAADGQLEASIVNFVMSLENIEVNSFADGTGFDFAGRDQKILSLPRVALTGGELRWPEQVVSLESVRIENPRIDVSRDAKGVFSIEPKRAQSAAEKIGEAIDETADTDENRDGESDSWQISVGNLDIEGLVLSLLDETVSPAAKLGITDFNLAIADISNRPGDRFPTSLELQALSGGKLALEGGISILPAPRFDFGVTVDSLQLSGLQPYIREQANLSMNSGAINLAGNISGSPDDPLLFEGDLELVDLAIAESITNKSLASWKRFAADTIELSIGDRRLDISRIHFDRLYGDILINEDGSLNVRQVRKTRTDPEASKTAGNEAETESGNDANPPAFNVSIGVVDLVEASADFADLSLPLPFAVKVDSLDGKMTTISTASSEPSEVSLEGKVDEFGYARVSGIVTPLQPAVNTDLEVSFLNIDVPKFTPYSIPFAGREVSSGRLDLKLGYKVQDSRLLGENSIVLRDFELGRKVPHPDALDLPLGLAVALLKDVDGKIDIDLPVRGNVDDPDFSYGGVVLQALGNLLLKIVVSPFTALGSMLGIEASELEHIKFPDGRADLTPPEMEKAKKLAEVLSQRPVLQLSTGGVFDPVADSEALRNARLNELLQQRIDAIAADGGENMQYAEQRRLALEQLYAERLGPEVAEQKLEVMRDQYTVPVEVEGETSPEPVFDGLAYGNALRDQLVGLQEVDDLELASLASARAESLKTALLGFDESLMERILITDNLSISRESNGSVEMKVILGSVAD